MGRVLPVTNAENKVEYSVLFVWKVDASSTASSATLRKSHVRYRGFHKWHNLKPQQPTPSPFNPFSACWRQSWPIKRRSLHDECVLNTQLRYHYMPLDRQRALVSWLMKSFKTAQKQNWLTITYIRGLSKWKADKKKTLVCGALAHTEKHDLFGSSPWHTRRPIETDPIESTIESTIHQSCYSKFIF